MTMKSDNQTRNCVLLYSKRHFDPQETMPLEQSSAGQIAKTLYMEIVENTEYRIHYFDAFDHVEWTQLETDLLITLVDNIDLAMWYFKPKRTILIAVNQHPLERIRINGESLKYGIPTKALTASDGIYQPFKSIYKANSILCVGNSKTSSTFEKYLKNSTIINTSYLSFMGSLKVRKEMSGVKNILILMSSIGYRKGFDRIYNSLMTEGEKLRDYQFHIIGHPEGDYWQKKIDELQAKYSNVHNHGWVLNNSTRFNELMMTMDIALFPTREEGLVGSLLECIQGGVISLYSENAGLDNKIENLTLTHNGSLELAEKILAVSKLTKSELQALADDQFSQLQTQLKVLPNIGSALGALIESGIPNSHGKNRQLRIIATWLKLPLGNFVPILIKRIRVIRIRILKAKLQIRSPKIYSLMKRIHSKLRNVSNSAVS